MKILFAGFLDYGSTSHSRMLALKDLGHEIIEIDYFKFFNDHKSLLNKLQQRFLTGPIISNLNSEVLKIDLEHKPDLIWIDKGIYIKPDVVKILKERNRFLIQHNTDDIKHANQTFKKFFIPAIPLFDVQITSNTFNLEDLKTLGAKNVIHMELAYNHYLHRPMDLSKEDYEKYKADISFIGHWEPNTEKYIVELREKGIIVRLLGTGWKNAYDRQLRYTKVEGVFGDEYVKALCASKINLCIVSVWNRNLTSARSFEIPACKTFLLAIRNETHSKYYAEGKEAEFFSDVNECAAKIKYYLEHDDERKRIAEAGYQRCLSSGYSDLARMKEVMKKVNEIYESKRK